MINSACFIVYFNPIITYYLNHVQFQWNSRWRFIQKKKKNRCKFCDEYKRGAVIFKHDTIPVSSVLYQDYNFFPNKLFSISLSKRNNIRHISKLHFSLQFSIQTAIFLLKISSSRGSRRIRNQGTRSSITIIHIIFDRNNFSFDTIKF